MKLKLILYMLPLLMLSSDLFAQNSDTRGIISDRPWIEKFEFIPYTGPTGPPEGRQHEPAAKGGPKGSRAQIIDSLVFEDLIPAQSTYAIWFDGQGQKFTKISPIPGLTSDAMEAIQASPKWLRNDLFDNLRRVDTLLQKELAQAILTADTLYRDEVAFQIAHLSVNMDLPRIDKALPLANAQGIYQIAPDLKYVKLVEHGSPTDGDWHTTTSYRIVNAAGDTVWKEIPYEVYYWWVLMPVIYEEAPKMDSTVQNEFWRTYVYNHADSGYPVLKDVLKDIAVFWDGKNYHWDNRDANRNPLPFSSDMSAVQVLGRWVAQTITEDAIAPRPIQPNITLYDHNGNCGEIQQMQTSGGRAALFPLMPVYTWPGDHIWNELYWPDSSKWAFYQIARVGGPTDINWTQTWSTSSCITAIRPDGYRWMINENYNPVCDVTVVVKDEDGKPVDGAEVIFVSTPSTDVHSLTQSVIGSWGHTNENGELTVKLGTNFNYFIRTDWSGGHFPVVPTLFYTLEHTTLTEGDHKWIYLYNGLSPAEDKFYNVVSAPEPDQRSIVVEYEVPYQVNYGGSYWNYNLWQDDYYYAYQAPRGSVSSFICNSENYSKYLDESEIEFDAYTFLLARNTSMMSVDLEEGEDYYIGLTNESRLNVAEFAKVKVYLYDGPTSIEENKNLQFSVFPNPSHGMVQVENPFRNSGKNGRMEVLNAVGKVVFETGFNGNESQQTIDLSALPRGIYFLRLSNQENSTVKKLVLQ